MSNKRDNNRPTRLLSGAFIKAIFYVPKGIVYPIAYIADYAKFVRLHSNIACEFCKNKSIKFKNDWVKYFKLHFAKWQKRIYPFVYALSQYLCAVVLRVFPRKTVRWCMSYLKALWKKRYYLEQNRSTFVLKYIVPFCVIMGLSFFWGLSFIPQLYIILLASNWAGKILNFCSNILVRRGETLEWTFLKECLLVILKRRPINQFYQDYQFVLRDFAKELILDLLIVGGIQRFSSFINYCFQAFFGWLVLYVLVKTAADEAPTMLLTLEGYLNEVASNSPPEISRQLGNGLWLLLYYTFLQTSSKSAQLHYQKLHQASHAACILLDCAETQGSNLNTSKGSLISVS